MNDEPLELPTDVIVLNEHAYNWGQRGPGTTKLAAAMLLQIMDRSLAIAWHHQFAGKVLSQLYLNEWRMTEEQIAQWIVDETIQELFPDKPWEPRSGLCSE